MSNQFTLRRIKQSDHPWLVELHNNYDVLRNLTHPLPITLDQHLAWWKKVKNDAFQDRQIFCVNDQRVGICKFYDIDHGNNNCVLGADIHHDHRGKGYAKPMWRLMLKRCFEEFGMYRVSLSTAEYNTVAQKVYRDLGFLEEGKLCKSLLRNNCYYDQLLMYMTVETWRDLRKVQTDV